MRADATAVLPIPSIDWLNSSKRLPISKNIRACRCLPVIAHLGHCIRGRPIVCRRITAVCSFLVSTPLTPFDSACAGFAWIGDMTNLDRDLVPTSKQDLARARAAVEAGYPAVAPILGELMKWLQDYNWPVAHILAPFLASIGAPLVPHIWHVLRTDDDVWKYWVIGILIPALPAAVAGEFRTELSRLCHHPQPHEKREELDTQAQEVLEHFGWQPEASS